MRRRLGVFARAPALTAEHAPFNVVVVLRLAGSPDPEILGRALEILATRHSLLRARIRGKIGRWRFETAAGAVPLQVVDRRGDDDWQPVAEKELETKVEAAGPLWRCVYLRSADGGRGELVLRFHHAIVDATSGVHLCAELLALCAAIAERGADEAPAEAGSQPEDWVEPRFPPAFRDLRRLRSLASFLGRQMADEVSFRWRSRRGRKPPIHPGARSRVLTFEIPGEIASRLARQARRRRLTLASALQAGLLLAVSRRLYGGRPQPLRSFTFPNLRPYLRPPVPAERLGGYFAVVRFTVAVDGGRDFWQLAREINERIHAANRRGEKYAAAFLSYRTMRLMLRRPTMRMGTAALSYTGVARLERAYGAIEVLSLHAFVTSTFLGPELAAQARLWDGRLWWDAVYLDADMDRETAQGIAEEIQTILNRAAREEE
jgi:hypothetical protein